MGPESLQKVGPFRSQVLGEGLDVALSAPRSFKLWRSPESLEKGWAFSVSSVGLNVGRLFRPTGSL